jgi:Flp pilus assembly pilin Flp
MPEKTNESGQTTVEYALVIALVSVGFGFALHALNVPFGHVVTVISNAISNAV